MRVTWARRLAGTLAGVVILLAACGQDSNPKLRLAGSPSSAAASGGGIQAPSAAASPQVTPNPVAAAVAKAAAADAAAYPAPTASPQPSGAVIPAGERLRIPSIGVDAPMVTLGVDGDGVMQVPSDGAHVGWYNFSALPGSPGNAVISGHLDTATSKQAVFSRLRNLKHGDAVNLIAGGKETDFEVFWTKSWPDDNAPLALILGNAPSPTLTLITCSGTWDQASKNYSNRLVVRAKLPGSV